MICWYFTMMNDPWFLPQDLIEITNCIAIATQRHGDKTLTRSTVRKYNGKPYVTHVIRVALALSSYPEMKPFWVKAALLHDTLEDTCPTPEHTDALRKQIVAECGGEVVLCLVEELTNEHHDKNKTSRRERKEKDWARLQASSREAKIIKMYDRIDNLYDMVDAPIDFKKLYVGESLELLKVIGDADDTVATKLQEAIKYLADLKE